MRERGKFQQFGDSRANVCIFQTEVAAIDQQVFCAGKVGIQRVRLPHHTEPRLDGEGVGRHLQAQFSTRGMKRDAARIRHRQTQAHADRCGLASAIGANDTQTFPRCDGKRHTVHHGGFAEAFAQGPDIQQGVGSEIGHAGIVR